MVNAPFWYFGGKRNIAPVVWKMLGDVPHYIEPFAGSLAVLLARPKTHQYTLSTVNDVNGYVSNVWRALQAAPDEVARYACWPVMENDLHARHIWLINRGTELVLRLEGDPEYFDSKVAGWYLWANASWIGSNFCNGKGMWNSDGVRRIDIRAADAPGVKRNLPHLGSAGQGVSRQLPHLGNQGRGVSRQLPNLGNYGNGVVRQVDGSRIEWLKSWFSKLQQAISDSRVVCGDWSRITTDAVLSVKNPTGIFLDPPYEHVDRHQGVYTVDDADIAVKTAGWAIEKASPRVRIVYAGYAGGEVEDMMRAANWRVYEWKSHKGHQHVDNINPARERLWYSPACLEPFAPKPQQQTLFGGS